MKHQYCHLNANFHQKGWEQGSISKSVLSRITLPLPQLLIPKLTVFATIVQRRGNILSYMFMNRTIYVRFAPTIASYPEPSQAG